MIFFKISLVLLISKGSAALPTLVGNEASRRRTMELKSWGLCSAHHSCFILDMEQWIACPVVAALHHVGSQITTSSLIWSQRGSHSLHVVQACCEMWAKAQWGRMCKRCVSKAPDPSPDVNMKNSQVCLHYLYFTGKWLTNFITVFVSYLDLGEVKDS